MGNVTSLAEDAVRGVQALRVLIYARVSEDKSGVGRSPEEQETDLLRRVTVEQWRHVGTIKESDRSASRYAKRERERWRDVLQAISAGGVDVLLVWEVSRLTRDMEEFVQFSKLCRKTGTRLAYNGRLYDLEDPDDEFQVQLDIGLGQRESGVTRKRVLRAMNANAQAGRPHGRILFGYRRVYDESSGRLQAQMVDEAQATVVREIFDRFVAGTSIRALARDLTERGLTTRRGKPWLTSQVRRVLTNPAYIGRRVHRGADVREAVWPAIVDRGVFYRAQALLTDPQRPAFGDTAAKHLLSGIARCGVCDAPLRIQVNRGYLAYLCSAGFCVSIRQEKLEEFVERLVWERLSRPDAALAWQRSTTQVADALAELSVLRTRLDGFYVEARAGRLSPGGLAAVEAPLLRDIADAEQRARSRQLPQALIDLVGTAVEARWKSPAFTMARKREVVRALMAPRVNRTYRGARSVEPGRLEPGWVVSNDPAPA